MGLARGEPTFYKIAGVTTALVSRDLINMYNVYLISYLLILYFKQAENCIIRGYNAVLYTVQAG